MAKRKPRLGSHMSITGGLPLAIDRAVATECEAIQIFTKSSGQWHSRPLPTDEIDQFRQRVEDTGIGPNVAHASYLINLASPDPTLRRRSKSALIDELARADALGLAGVVLHPGAYTTSTEAEGLDKISDGIAEVFDEHPPGSAQLLLEHTAGQGTVLGHQFEHLHTIIESLQRSMRIGVCLDTCHLVAAGYDLLTEDGYADVFSSFDRIVGLDRIKVFHLNDSKYPLGSRRDRHEHIGHGYLGLAPFERLLNDDRFADKPMVLETAKTGGKKTSSIEADPMDLENLSALRSLY